MTAGLQVCVWVLKHLRRTAMKLWLSKRTHSPKPMINAPKICETEESQTPYRVLELNRVCASVSYFCFLSLSHLGLIRSQLFSPSACVFLSQPCKEGQRMWIASRNPLCWFFSQLTPNQPATEDLLPILQYPNSKVSLVK